MKILGVTVQEDLSASSHVEEILGGCSGSLHVLHVLRAHGMPETVLHVVAAATTVARVLYAALAWWGFTSADNRTRFERHLTRMKRMGFLPMASPGVEERVGVAEDRLLSAVTWSHSHVLCRIFPPKVRRQYNLRPRPHDFVLPTKNKRNFIPRVLYKHIIILVFLPFNIKQTYNFFLPYGITVVCTWLRSVNRFIE